MEKITIKAKIDTVLFSIRVEKSLAIRLEAIARESNRSRNNIINLACGHFVRNVEIAEGEEEL